MAPSAGLEGSSGWASSGSGLDVEKVVHNPLVRSRGFFLEGILFDLFKAGLAIGAACRPVWLDCGHLTVLG